MCGRCGEEAGVVEAGAEEEGSEGFGESVGVEGVGTASTDIAGPQKTQCSEGFCGWQAGALAGVGCSWRYIPTQDSKTILSRTFRVQCALRDHAGADVQRHPHTPIARYLRCRMTEPSVTSGGCEPTFEAFF